MTDDSWLDGNAVAGPLEELFGFDLTAVPRRCASCGEARAMGAHRLYRGAGLVLRCPSCGDVAAIICTDGDGHLVQLAGTWRLDSSRSRP